MKEKGGVEVVGYGKNEVARRGERDCYDKQESHRFG